MKLRRKCFTAEIFTFLERSWECSKHNAHALELKAVEHYQAAMEKPSLVASHNGILQSPGEGCVAGLQYWIAFLALLSTVTQRQLWGWAQYVVQEFRS